MMATRQTRRQLQFSGFEMAMIAVSFVVTVTAVFFLGLFVGKKNASYHAPAEDRVARIPVDDFTRYKRPAPIEKAPKPERPATVEADATATAPADKADIKPVEASAAGLAESGKAATVSSQAGPAPTPSATAPVAVPVSPAADAKAAPPVAEPAASAALPAAAAPPDAAAVAAAKEAAKAKELAAKEAAAAKQKEKEKELAEASTGRGYTVQILATRKQADADALVAKLKSRGFAAYIKKVTDGAGAWYRVRVGSYGAFGEAKGMADKCRRDLGLGQAFVSTE